MTRQTGQPRVSLVYMSDLNPADPASPSFSTRLRGYDPTEVRTYLDSVAAVMADLTRERDRLAALVSESANRDLKTEFETVGREVAAVLEAAREAAESMRQRAGLDASKWRAEAVAEVEAERRRARSDAEHLRGDAWSAAEDLLRQAQTEATRIREEADKEALRVVGESELATHRAQSSARRESEELVRTARMEAERLLAEAKNRHDQMIEQAQRQADAAQERARALESRRQDLVKELEAVRASLNQVELELDERRSALNLSPPAPAPAVAPPDRKEWEDGAAVRVVRPDGQVEGESGSPAAGRPRIELEPSPEIRVLSASEMAQRRRPASLPPPPVVETAPEEPAVEPVTDEVVGEDDQEVAGEPVETAVAEDEGEGSREEGEPETELVEDDEEEELSPTQFQAATVRVREVSRPRSVAEAGTAPVQLDLDEVSGLFARLRDPSEPEPEPEHEPEQPRSIRRTSRVDVGQIREKRLLPVTNRALRNLKRQLTDEANLALDQLRSTSGAWEPPAEDLANRLKADMVVLYAESHGAGHGAAEEMLGERIARPATPRFDAGSDFTQALVGELNHVLEEGRAVGHGPQQLGSAVSRVFRAWRTDEAERRVRNLALTAYHQGLAASLTAAGRDLALEVGGRGCATCRAAAEGDVTADRLPPFHPGCECVLGSR